MIRKRKKNRFGKHGQPKTLQAVSRASKELGLLELNPFGRKTASFVPGGYETRWEKWKFGKRRKHETDNDVAERMMGMLRTWK